MPVANFDYTKHIKAITRQLHNEALDIFFKNIKGRDGKPIQIDDNSVSTSLSSLKTACRIERTDSLIMIQSKATLFDLLQRSLLPTGRNSSDFYAIPIEDYHERVQFKPQIMLLFRQRIDEVPSGRRPIEGQIGFRWMKENISEFNAESMANKINSILGPETSPEHFRRGAVICNYVRPEEGYRMRVYADSESEGRRIIEKVVSLQEHSFDSDFFSFSQTRRNLRSGNESRFIYGESRDLPRERPEGEVYFYRAELKIWGVRPDVTLVDYSGRRSDLLD